MASLTLLHTTAYRPRITATVSGSDVKDRQLDAAVEAYLAQVARGNVTGVAKRTKGHAVSAQTFAANVVRTYRVGAGGKVALHFDGAAIVADDRVVDVYLLDTAQFVQLGVSYYGNSVTGRWKVNAVPASQLTTDSACPNGQRRPVTAEPDLDCGI